MGQFTPHLASLKYFMAKKNEFLIKSNAIISANKVQMHV